MLKSRPVLALACVKQPYSDHVTLIAVQAGLAPAGFAEECGMPADPTCSDIGTSCSGRLQHPLSRLRDENAFPSQLVANAKAAGLKTFAYTFRSEVRLGPSKALPPGSNCCATATPGLRTSPCIIYWREGWVSAL